MNNEDADSASIPDINPYDLLALVDILSKDFYDKEAKKWQERKEALELLEALVKNPKLENGDYGDVVRALKKIISKNSNDEVITLAVKCLAGLAAGLKIRFQPNAVACLSIILEKLSEVEQTLQAFREAFNDIYESISVARALKSTRAALENKNPAVRAKAAAYLARCFARTPPVNLNEELFKFSIGMLLNMLNDSDLTVRDNSAVALGTAMKLIGEKTMPLLKDIDEPKMTMIMKCADKATTIHLSYEAMVRNTEKLKPGLKTADMAALDKARPSSSVKPLSKKEPSDNNIQNGGAKFAKVAKVVKAKGASSKPGSARTKDDNVDTSPLLVINSLKHQRVTDEKNLKVLKWNFTTPREEFVMLLKNLMTTANVNKTLRANMFHSDFRYHLKAIEALTEDIPGNSKALVSNLDLILKWFTLRFFDTNPSVHQKGLDYLQLVFNMLIEDQYHISETEAASFIPYLIIKIGDPNNAVRDGVRALFKQMALVYPVTKLFSYVMEGLKSKNARQRTECLDKLGSLIEDYGVLVCQPSPSAALKEVAKQIEDRDNSVRNAALNCIIQAYLFQGNHVFKLIGQISKKNRSLLDERIKSTGNNQPAKSASATRPYAPAVAASSPPTDDMEADYEEEKQEHIPNTLMETMKLTCVTSTTDNNEDKQVPTVVIIPSQPDQEIVDNHETDTHNRLSNRDDSKTNSPTSMQAKFPACPWRLDLESLRRIEPSIKYRNPILTEPCSSSDLNKPPVNVLNPPKTLMVPTSPSKMLVSKSSSAVSPATASSEDSTLDHIILSMASMDLPTAIRSMKAIKKLLKSHQAVSLQSKEDKFIGSINIQLKLLQTYLREGEQNMVVSEGFIRIFLVTRYFYATRFLGKNVSFKHLKKMLHQITSLRAGNKLKHFHKARHYYKMMNSFRMDIIDQSNHTTIICVLIELLSDSCAESNVHQKYDNLLTKGLCMKAIAMSGCADDIDYDTILLKVHNFLKNYPTTWWKKRKSDKPLRVVKKLLRSMARVKNSSLFNHFTLISNKEDSELHGYLITFIASLE